MGDVFLALYGRAGRERLCVVKRLIPGRRPDRESVERFRREAEIVRTLAHGVIAQTIAIDELDGEPYIVQEFIEGRNLTQLASAARSAGESIPYQLAVHIVREVARALAYAHRAAGVVHRDVAPENIMVTFSGETRLIDFGLARGNADSSLTRPGVIVGRYSYTAPEVLRGVAADRRADIYSLGVVLWQLLTGRDPSFAELDAPPAPSSIRSALPPELDTVALRALSSDPDDRYETAEEFQRALGPFLPPSFLGEQALADFIGRCYDIETQRCLLRAEIEQARPLLQTGGSVGRADGRRSIVWMGGLVALFGLLSIGLLSTRGRTHRKTARLEVSPLPAQPAEPPDRPILSRASEWERPVPHVPDAPAVPPSRLPPAPRRAMARAGAPSRREPEAAAAGRLLDRARDSLLTGDLAAAERIARESLLAGSAVQRARAHVIVGQVLVLRGENGAAADEFSDAIELDPSNEAAAAALAQIRRHRSAP
jgi:eukaryotic-like serine/threonine-protein kinase